MKCWASSVSKCCSTQSREHYITKGLFASKTIEVRNAPFLNGVTKKISKSSLAKKCLCKKHNELLSIYDSEAIKFGKSLEYARNLSIERKKISKRKINTHKKQINREKIIRWFIKTFLGFNEFFRYPSAISESYLAQLVYSQKEKATDRIKFKFEHPTTEDLVISQVVTIAPLEKNNKTIGMEIEIYGIRIHGIFDQRIPKCNKALKIKFYEYQKHKKVLSCLIEIK